MNYKKLNKFVKLRRQGYTLWMAKHPEGITKENYDNYRKFMRANEREGAGKDSNE